MPTHSPYAVQGTHMFTLVDRALTGGTEIIVDGQRIVFKPGQVEQVVSRALIEWLYGVEQQMVWTTEGAFVQRFAVKDPSPDLLAAIGPEAGDCSPIEIDTTRAERSDTTGFARPHPVTPRPVAVPPGELREKQGAGSHIVGASGVSA